MTRSITVLLSLALLAIPARADHWQFVVVGDTRSNSTSDHNGVNTVILGELASQIAARKASQPAIPLEFVLMPGDLAYSGTTAGAFTTWKSTMAPVYNANIGVYTVRGNHDLESSGAWNTAFSYLPDNGPAAEANRTYSVTSHNALILGLDDYTYSTSSPLQLTAAAETWTLNQLASNTKPHVFVFGHDPAFKVNHTDCLDDNVTQRDRVWNAIAAAGGRAYFAGHDHFYDHARIDDGDGNPNDDIQQFIVGSGGAPLNTGTYPYNGANSTFTPTAAYHDPMFGYLVVDINNNDVTMTWYRRNTSDLGVAGTYAATSEIFSYSVPEPAALTFVALALLPLSCRRPRLSLVACHSVV